VTELDEERLDERTTLLSVRGDAQPLDAAHLIERIEAHTAERVIVDLTAARHVDSGLGEALSAVTERLGEAARRLIVVSGDPDLRQALTLAGGESVAVAASRDEALQQLG
jgi:anti-anti-sigma regulatory factor